MDYIQIINNYIVVNANNIYKIFYNIKYYNDIIYNSKNVI